MWVARAIKACLDNDSPYVQNFYELTAETPSILTSGRARSWRRSARSAVGAELTSFKKTFETKVYYTEGKSVITCKLSASQFKKDYILLAGRGEIGNSYGAMRGALKSTRCARVALLCKEKTNARQTSARRPRVCTYHRTTLVHWHRRAAQSSDDRTPRSMLVITASVKDL